MVLETGLALVLVNVKGLGGAGALRELIDSNRSFPVMSTFSTVLAALETLWHIDLKRTNQTRICAQTKLRPS